MQHSNEFLDLVNSMRPHVQEVDTDTVFQWQQDGKDFTLIDVREDHEWAKGRLPEAIHLGKGIIERDIKKVVPNKDKCIVLQCGGGSRSILAAQNLQLMGYTNVYSLAGGWRDWSAKYPTIND